MKKIGMTLLILVCSAFLAVSDDLMFQPAAVVNLVRPQMISMNELNAAYEEYRAGMQQQNQPVTRSREDMLWVLIENELLMQGARRQGIVVREEEIQAELAQQRQSVAMQLGRQSITDDEFVEILTDYFGISLAAFREDIRNKLQVERYIFTAKRDLFESVPEPAEQEIRRVYRENATDFINPEYALIHHVFVDKRDKSEAAAFEKISEALSLLESGEKSFSELVREVSEDDSTLQSDGRLGWIAINDARRRQLLGERFLDAVFELSRGETSEIIESRAGYHIIYMADHRNAAVLGLQDPLNPSTNTTVYEYIGNILYNQRQSQVFNQAVDDLVDSLREEADIRILL